MNIIEKLKSLGTEVTAEMEKAFAGEWVSDLEVQKKTDKIKTLEAEKETLVTAQTNMQKTLEDLKASSADVELWKTKVTELNATIEKERSERAEKEQAEKFVNQVEEFCKDKHFVNDITASAIKAQLTESLKSENSRGVSISDFFDKLVKDETGKIKPNILIDEKNFKAGQNAAYVITNPINTGSGTAVTKEQFFKMNFSERSKLKATAPELYEQLKKG